MPAILHPPPAIHFVVEEHPVGKQRTRGTKSGRHYTPQKTVDYENAVKFAFNKARLKWEERSGTEWPMDGEFLLSFDIYAKTYTRPDVSNVAKSIEDALNAVAYHDDGDRAVLRQGPGGLAV